MDIQVHAGTLPQLSLKLREHFPVTEANGGSSRLCGGRLGCAGAGAGSRGYGKNGDGSYQIWIVLTDKR